MRSTRTVAGAFLVAALAGCATTEPASVLGTGPRMIELYRGTAVEPAPGERGAPQAPEGTVPEAPKGAVVQARCRWGWFRWRCEAPAATPPAACACGDAPAYTRTAADELELLFPRLPNPDLYIYVPPHLATALRIPVPGYTTAVPLYDRVEYALPGEGGAARAPGEAPPGAGPGAARVDASAEEAGSGVSPEDAPSGACPEEARPGANPGEARSGTSPGEIRPETSLEEAPPRACPEEGRSGARVEEVRPGASPEQVPPGVSPDEAGPDVSMEAAP